MRRKPTADMSASKGQAHKAANSYQADFGEDEILKLQGKSIAYHHFKNAPERRQELIYRKE
jgi:hypothetical protein